MKILMINKFLHANGGSETYMMCLGQYLSECGHTVEYFGMEHEKRCVGNSCECYTSNMDFHSGSIISKLSYPFRTIYSSEARKKLRIILEKFCPDAVHINNFNYQLTPSVILELVKWKKEGHKCRIVYTAHDCQLVCPNHMCRNPLTDMNCEKCIGGHYLNCIKGKCIHGSRLRSIIGAAESFWWHSQKTYRYFDTVICCSHFLKEKLDTLPELKGKTVAMHNFVNISSKNPNYEKKDYVLYFGRFSKEKGVGTLVNVCKELPEIQFIFAGSGPLEEQVNSTANIRNIGFVQGEELHRLIGEAMFSVYPSECYENCPFSVIESQILGTPVIGADIGGIPEIMDDGITGEPFKSGDMQQLKQRVQDLWNNRELLSRYSENCRRKSFSSIEDYTRKLIQIYKGE